MTHKKLNGKLSKKEKRRGWSTRPVTHSRQEHGLSKLPEYNNWQSMRGRCYNKRAATNYARWGAKGITVCDRWMYGENGVHPFVCFLQDMGRRPSPVHQLDRYPDEHGNYEPGNVRWATPQEQAWNKVGKPRPDLAEFNRARRGKPLSPEHRAKIAPKVGVKRGPYKKHSKV